MTNTNEHMPCPVCKGEVNGRSDKRYCSIKCKNKHHRIAFLLNKPMTDEKNRRLLRNLTLLEGIVTNENNFMTIHKSALIKLGFDTSSITGVEHQGKTTIFECYHFRYWIDRDGLVHVVRNAHISDYMPGFYERHVIDFPLDVRFDRRFRRELERRSRKRGKTSDFMELLE